MVRSHADSGDDYPVGSAEALLAASRAVAAEWRERSESYDEGDVSEAARKLRLHCGYVAMHPYETPQWLKAAVYGTEPPLDDVDTVEPLESFQEAALAAWVEDARIAEIEPLGDNSQTLRGKAAGLRRRLPDGVGAPEDDKNELRSRNRAMQNARTFRRAAVNWQGRPWLRTSEVLLSPDTASVAVTALSRQMGELADETDADYRYYARAREWVLGHIAASDDEAGPYLDIDHYDRCGSDGLPRPVAEAPVMDDEDTDIIRRVSKVALAAEALETVPHDTETHGSGSGTLWRSYRYKGRRRRRRGA